MHQLDMGFAGASGTTIPHIRAKARAADWRRQLARGLQFAMGKSPQEAEALIAEYERQEREGPDFARQRPASVICDAPIVRLDRNERVRLMVMVVKLARRSWSAKDKGRHRGIVTRTAEAVFEALIYLASKYERIYPTLEGLAYLARCCRASVATALADLERLGFITRIRRLRRIETPLGFTTQQTSNAYEIHQPARGLGALFMAVITTESSYSTPTATESIQTGDCGDWGSAASGLARGDSQDRCQTAK